MAADPHRDGTDPGTAERPTILVVEDERIVAKDVQATLGRLGYAVPVTASSGEEAVRLADSVHPDLVLMDVRLEGEMDGVEAAKQIHSRYGIPVVFLTAYGDDVTLQRAKLTEPFGYVLKPFKERELHTTIEIALYKHRMERSLREKEEWLRTTMNSIGDAVIATDERGNVIFMNPVAQGLTGWSEKDATGRPLSEVFHIRNEETGREVESPVVKVLAHGVIVGLANHTVLITRDGKVIPIRDSGAPIKDQHGTVRGVALVFQDISERKQAEDALRRSEERYRVLYEDNPTMYFTVAPEGTVLSVNHFGASQLGYAVEDLVGTSVLGIFHPEDREAVARQVESCLKDPAHVHHWEFRKIRKDGTFVWVKETARAVRGEGGGQVVLVVCEDITEKKRAEQAESELKGALEKSAQEWALTFDSMETPILILDAGGRIARLNRAARDLAEAPESGLTGRPVAEVAPMQPWLKAGDLAAEAGRARTGKQEQVRDPVTMRTWDITASPFPGPAEDGERVIVVARDVTQMVDLQESLRRSETMSAMGALVAGVAHEVRNPLFSISANLDAFEARFGDRGEYAETIAVLRSEADRLVALMNELLDYGRPIYEKPSSEALEGVVAQAVHSCASLAQRGRVKVVSRVESGCEPLVMDRKRMIQVFRNLLENAIQHSPAGGDVVVEAEQLKAEGRTWVACAVKDSGPGFDAGNLERVFEPFFTRRRGGTGLGLAIAQRIVEGHGGTLVAANRPEGGAVLTVRLPTLGPRDSGASLTDHS